MPLGYRGFSISGTCALHGPTGCPSNRPARAANEKWYPDHAIYNATKDQIKAMPQFKYD